MSKIEIYTKHGCPYCVRAKRLLQGKGVAYNEFDVTFDADKKREMVSRSGRQTVPQVFIDGTHVGGSDDLALADQSGQLDRILKSGSADAA